MTSRGRSRSWQDCSDSPLLLNTTGPAAHRPRICKFATLPVIRICGHSKRSSMGKVRKPLTVGRKLLKMLLPATQQPSTSVGPPPVIRESSAGSSEGPRRCWTTTTAKPASAGISRIRSIRGCTPQPILRDRPPGNWHSSKLAPLASFNSSDSNQARTGGAGLCCRSPTHDP